MSAKWVLSPRQRCDLELLLIDGFKPLTGFLGQEDYQNVLENLRLADDTVWPMPIMLDIPSEFAQKLEVSQVLGLYNTDNMLLANLTITDKWQPNKLHEAEKVFGTHDTKHPGVDYLLNRSGDWYIGGKLQCVQLPPHFDFQQWRYTPAQLKKLYQDKKINKIVGFQTRNPLHRSHMELTKRAAEQIGGHVLLHPVVGLTRPGDIDYFTRVRCYQKILPYYPDNQVILSLLPLAMRMGGPREALWHALIRKNYGCTHFIIGRDHAGPGNDSNNKPFYDPYAAQDLVNQYVEKIGIEILNFQEMVYVKERKRYCSINEVQKDETALSISGTQLRNALLTDDTVPSWFSFPEIIEELKSSYPAKHKQGCTLFFTGLSGAGKTTIAQALLAQLMSEGKKNITLLDGDEIRKHLSSELGFSREHRDINIRRMGFIASEISKVGGMVLVAAIAPYNKVRQEVRQLVTQVGNYIEIYISTPLKICENRDTKGLYAKARNGELLGFTGVNDPYEEPINPEIMIDSSTSSIQESVDQIIKYLIQNNYLVQQTQNAQVSTRRNVNEGIAFT